MASLPTEITVKATEIPEVIEVIEHLRGTLIEIRDWCRGPKQLPADLIWLTALVENALKGN